MQDEARNPRALCATPFRKGGLSGNAPEGRGYRISGSHPASWIVPCQGVVNIVMYGDVGRGELGARLGRDTAVGRDIDGIDAKDRMAFTAVGRLEVDPGVAHDDARISAAEADVIFLPCASEGTDVDNGWRGRRARLVVGAMEARYGLGDLTVKTDDPSALAEAFKHPRPVLVVARVANDTEKIVDVTARDVFERRIRFCAACCHGNSCDMLY